MSEIVLSVPSGYRPWQMGLQCLACEHIIFLGYSQAVASIKQVTLDTAVIEHNSACPKRSTTI